MLEVTCKEVERGNEARAVPLEALVESLLFVAGEPISVETLAAVLSSRATDVESALERLANLYEDRGVLLQR